MTIIFSVKTTLSDDISFVAMRKCHITEVYFVLFMLNML